MLVHPQVPQRKFLSVNDQKCAALPTSLVAPCRLPRLESAHQPLAEVKVMPGFEGLSHGGNGLASNQHVSLRSKPRAVHATEPVGTVPSREGRASAARVDHAKLADLPAGILTDDALQRRIRSFALSHESQSVDREVQIGPRLGCDRTHARLCPGHHAPGPDVGRRYRDAELAGALAPANDRERREAPHHRQREIRWFESESLPALLRLAPRCLRVWPRFPRQVAAPRAGRGCARTGSTGPRRPAGR